MVVPSRIRRFQTRSLMFVLCLVSHAVEIVFYLHYHIYSHIQKTGGATTFQLHFTNKAKWSIFPWSYFLLDYFRNRISAPAPARSKVVSSFSLPVGKHFLFLILIAKTLIHNDEKKNSTAYGAEKRFFFLYFISFFFLFTGIDREHTEKITKFTTFTLLTSYKERKRTTLHYTRITYST